MRASFDQRVLLAAALVAIAVPALAPRDAHGLSAIVIEVESTQTGPVRMSQPGASAARPAAEGSAPAALGADERTPILEHPVPSLAGPDPLFDDDFFDEQHDVYDPLEGMNRLFFGFNRYADRFVWTPITTAYQWAVPEPGRRAVLRAFRNLGSAPIFVNDLLQLRFRDAGETLGRFVLNSTVGMAGFFDAAVEAGWEYHHSDFGQTLAMVGVGKGPYLVLPILGPTTTRDGFGVVVDRAFEPLTYVFGFGLLGPTIQILIGAGNGVATRDVYVESMTALEESSVDFYAALRSVYVQNREAEIWAHRSRPDGTPPRNLEIDEEGPEEVEVLGIDDARVPEPIGYLLVGLPGAPGGD
jgi:phospholipid-binding lipoprotein MlaA